LAEDLKRDYREDLTLFEGPWSRWLAVALIAALAVFGLFFANDFLVYILQTLAIFVAAAVGLNLLVGYTGQISLGHAAFLAVGAYSHIILYTEGAPLPVTLLAAAVTAGVAGFIVGIPALRLEGPYLAIATLGFQVAVDQILGRWDSVTGGRMGLGVPYPEEVVWLSRLAPFEALGLGWQRLYFFLCSLVALAVIVGVYNLSRSRVGRAFVAIRDNDTAAEAMGVSLVRYKTLAFAISAGITGLAGALYAHLFDRINPSNFSLLMSIEMLVMILVGGLASVLGSVLGAALLVFLQHSLTAFRDYQSIIIGGILVGVLLFEPMGMRGRWLRIKYYFKAWPF
jgi:branched-chain amino acid transport system permease protein